MTKSLSVERLALPLCLAIAFTVVATAGAAQAAAKKEVLFIDAYHQGLPWIDRTVNGLRSVLRDVNLSIDYLDAKRITPTDEYLDKFAALYAYKLSKKHYDLIIAGERDGLRLVADHPEVFKGIPIVHLGVNGFREEFAKGNPMITGNAEIDHWQSTIATGLKQNPKAKTVYVIGDRSATAKTCVEDVRGIEGAFPGVRFVYLADGDTAPMLDKLRKASNAIAVLTVYTHDNDDRYFSHEESARIISAAAAVPVYGVWDMVLGSGVVGGRMEIAEEHAAEAARMALRILNGASVSSIPTDRSGKTHFMFDRKALRRFHIPMSRVPKGSRLIH